MTTQIGVGFGGTTETTGKYYVNLVLNDDILEVYPELKKFNFTLWENKSDNEKAPAFNLVRTLKTEKK